MVNHTVDTAKKPQNSAASGCGGITALMSARRRGFATAAKQRQPDIPPAMSREDDMSDGYTHGIPAAINAPVDCPHHWEPAGMVFETQLLDQDGRVRVRQPDMDEGRCYFICRLCASHTYMTTQWIGFRMYGSEDAAVTWDGDDPIPANNKRVTPATQRAAWHLT